MVCCHASQPQSQVTRGEGKCVCVVVTLPALCSTQGFESFTRQLKKDKHSPLLLHFKVKYCFLNPLIPTENCIMDMVSTLTFPPTFLFYSKFEDSVKVLDL